MSFQEILLENKITIMDKWVDAVLSTYPADGGTFFKKQKDRFANPLGYNAKTGIEEIFNLLLANQQDNPIPSELEQFIKLRAVQTFTPSEAVSFIYSLKQIIVDACGKQKLAEHVEEWLNFESRIDGLALRIFDLYMESRERIYQIKVNEYTSGNHIMARTRCSSKMMRKNKEEKIELKVFQDR